MSLLHADAPRSSVANAGHRLRGDIQGMRAIAVVLVVLYHFFPGRMPGGYVGVDVFFVISGFLITGHLLRELESSGTIRLGRFYARRIRRLLPAAILVLAVTVVAALLLLPSSQLMETLRQVAASATYIENWFLQASAVDYMAQDAAPTPVQHYWSLSVEEQFYLIWPAIILLVASLARRAGVRRGHRSVLTALIVLGLASLVLSVFLTAADKPSAYFATPTRIWEFAAGALIVFLPRLEGAERLRALVAWAGIAAIAYAAFTFTDISPFPGAIAAIPVLGASALIWGGEAQSARWMPGRWLAVAPFRFLGDSSYAIYLWHWPVVVLLPLALGTAASAWIKLFAIGAVVIVAWASTRWFETPIRQARWLARPVAPFLLALISALLFWGVWAAGYGVTSARTAAAAEQTAELVGTECYGAAALLQGCEPLTGDPSTIDPALAAADAQNPEYTRCDQRLDESALVVCEFGPSDASVRLALVGDSHATQWLGALERMATDEGWHVETYLKSSCPLTFATRILPEEPRKRLDACSDWQQQVRKALTSSPVDAVLVSSYARGYGWASTPDGPVSDQAGVDGFVAQWLDLAEDVAPVIVIADTPYLGGVNVPDCVATTDAPYDACSADRSSAIVPDVMSAAVAASGSTAVTSLDMSDLFCDEARCFAVIGGEIVYRDTSHLTWNYAASTAPEFARRLDELVSE